MLYLTLYCEKNEKNQKSPGLAHLNKTKGGDAKGDVKAVASHTRDPQF